MINTDLLDPQALRERRSLSQAEVDRRTRSRDLLDPTATERLSSRGHRTASPAGH